MLTVRRFKILDRMHPKVPDEVVTVLEEMLKKTESCQRNNDYILHLTKNISKLTIENSQSTGQKDSEKFSGYKEDSVKSENDAGSIKFHADLEQMENILQEKLQENERLKLLNERLLLNSQQKAQKIKESTHTASLYNEHKLRTKEISVYKDKIGKYNVEIQKLKKQLCVETKALQNEKAKVLRLQKNRRSMEANQDSLLEIGNDNIIPPKKKLKKNDRKETLRTSFEELDKLYIQRSLKIIKMNGESNINEETLDEPENLDSDLDEKSSDQMHEIITSDESKEYAESISRDKATNGEENSSFT